MENGTELTVSVQDLEEGDQDSRAHRRISAAFAKIK